MKRGFTLIESLAVIAIIGVLASLAIYVAKSALEKGRDARRKSDLTAVSLGFQARYESKTCPDSKDVGFYPARHTNAVGAWKNIDQLRTLNNDCGSFSEYLLTIPSPPAYRLGGQFPYQFNISDNTGEIVEPPGKHYRLTAVLERGLSSEQELDLARKVDIWHNSFGGVESLPSGYNYIIGN